MSQLTDKQQAFVDEYLVDLNGTQAAIRAGYSQTSAYSIAEENLRKPEIADAIAKAKKERQARVQIDADWLLRELVLQYQKANDGDREAAALKALDLIGKHVEVGAFNNKLEIAGNLALSHEDALKELE